MLGSRHNQLDHRSLKGILGGTRTPNLEIRSLTPYPLGHEDTSLLGEQLIVVSARARVARDKMPRVGFEPTHSFEYLNLSQAP